MTSQVKSMGGLACWMTVAAQNRVSRMKTLEERIGRRIAIQRKAVGLTQAQLAERVDVQPETISRIETGSQSASLGLIANVSDAIELELHELFRLPGAESQRNLATDRLLWFASRLTPAEIDLVMDVGAAVLGHTRRLKVRE